MFFLGLKNCLPAGNVDHKLGDGKGAVLFEKSRRDFLLFKLSLLVVSSVVPIAVLVHVWPTNGCPIVDLIRVSDHIPTSLCPGCVMAATIRVIML